MVVTRAEVFGREYRPEFFWFDGATQTATCGENALGPYNAYYCPVDHTVTFDAQLFLAALAGNADFGGEIGTSIADPGDTLIFMILAHEWGHAIQAHFDQRSADGQPRIRVAGGLLRWRFPR
ncbi:MAG: hypothetical protein R2706_11555 [Acidimicrobiales bacterium]